MHLFPPLLLPVSLHTTLLLDAYRVSPDFPDLFRYDAFFIGLFCVSQAGMDTLQEWDFEKYSESAAKKALNHNIKHVMKEGGRAGKALMVNTDKLVNTVQILGTAGGAAKAVQAISVTKGVMSALFLALDVFFLAKDSHKLRKGAKTKFAKKIRDVCKELQDGLLDLNKVKTQLQKTMDGIEVEEYEEIEEVEVEADDDLASDPKKLAELELELDLLEEKLDKKAEAGEKRSRGVEKEQEKSQKGTKKGEEKEDDEKKRDSKFEGEESEQKHETGDSAKAEVVKGSTQKERKADKEAANYVKASKEKPERVKDAEKEESGLKDKTDVKEKTGKEHARRAQSESKQEQRRRAHPRRESERRGDAEGEVNAKEEVKCGSMRSKHDNRETEEQNKTMEERRRSHRRAEIVKSPETGRGSQREGDVRKKKTPSSREERERRHPRPAAAAAAAAAHDEPMEARVEKSRSDGASKRFESAWDKDRRRSRDGDTEGRTRHRASGGQSSVLREDGLYI